LIESRSDHLLGFIDYNTFTPKKKKVQKGLDYYCRACKPDTRFINQLIQKQFHGKISSRPMIPGTRQSHEKSHRILGIFATKKSLMKV